MSDCNWLSDRMPAVALGRAEWTLDEAGHLGECRSCQVEWELVQAAGRLGAATLPAPDPESMTRAMLHRLMRDEVQSRPRVWILSALAAAALAAAVWTGGDERGPSDGAPAEPIVARLEWRLPELESLQAAELDSVLRTMDDSTALDSPDASGLGDLDAEELQRVLDTWEG